MVKVTTESLTLALAGLLIVFSVLALIATVTALVRRLDERWRRHESELAERAITKTPTIDLTTLVLIAAAVATVTAGRHRIRRIRRLLSPAQPRSPWSAQGRQVLMGSHVPTRRPR